MSMRYKLFPTGSLTELWITFGPYCSSFNMLLFQLQYVSGSSNFQKPQAALKYWSVGVSYTRGSEQRSDWFNFNFIIWC